MIKPFLNDNFLLENAIAERLYHEFAKDLPIIDYHNHLPPEAIANNKKFSTITDIWLNGDHYKWRAMRANGIDEKYITGDASAEGKFLKWAETVPQTMRNPLYHWTHLELQRYFGIDELLNPESAPSIYKNANQQLQTEAFSTLNLLEKMKVEVVCTTDNPTDDLAFHKVHASSNSTLKMLPTFRPDNLVVITDDFLYHLSALEKIIDKEIATFDDLIYALENRVNFFHDHGCLLADHGLSQLFDVDFKIEKLNEILQKAKAKQALLPEEKQAFQMATLHHLAEMYYERGWTMQFHLGPLRNNNSRLLKLVGADAGCDSIGDFKQAKGLSAFLNRLDAKGKLTKTILYNLNPRDNEVFASMAGNFNGDGIPGKIQWGSAWWFLDQKDGMEKQINTLSNFGLLSRFIGMLTDSRSFLSFPRHEYFRRILCNLIGHDVHNGELPNDIVALGEMVENVCFKNAKQYFNF